MLGVHMSTHSQSAYVCKYVGVNTCDVYIYICVYVYVSV